MAVGTHKGFVQIWDAAAGKKLSVLEGHTARVGECSVVLDPAAGSLFPPSYYLPFLSVSGKRSRFRNRQALDHLSG